MFVYFQYTYTQLEKIKMMNLSALTALTNICDNSKLVYFLESVLFSLTTIHLLYLPLVRVLFTGSVRAIWSIHSYTKHWSGGIKVCRCADRHQKLRTQWCGFSLNWWCCTSLSLIGKMGHGVVLFRTQNYRSLSKPSFWSFKEHYSEWNCG